MPPSVQLSETTKAQNYPQDQATESESNPAFFRDLTFSLPDSTHSTGESQYWSIVSPSSLTRTTFLQILAGQHTCLPHTARTYPLLARRSKSPPRAIKYVGFDAERGSSVSGTSVRGAYLSSRYESRREITDFSLYDYLTGNTELNALERETSDEEKKVLDETIQRLNLQSLLHMPVSNLSNGQTRRARIAKALMARPELVLLDGPFMGLDPNTLARMAEVLHQLAQAQSPRLILSLRPEDIIPNWISHLVLADEKMRVTAQGPKSDVLPHISNLNPTTIPTHTPFKPQPRLSKDGFPALSPALPPGEPIVEMQGVKVSYSERTVLGAWSQPSTTSSPQTREGLSWTLHRGQRYGIFGANGSGKTTLLSLITSDHPQTYGLPIKLFGRSRVPGPGERGISIFDLQRRMGHSSPEVHAFFPKQLSVRRVLESAWADAPMAKAKLGEGEARRVDAVLRWFARELNPGRVEVTALERLDDVAHRDLGACRRSFEGLIGGKREDVAWAEEVRLWELSFSAQRLVLFLRALVASSDLVILDEALSGIDEGVRDKAFLFLSHGEKVRQVVDGKLVPSTLSKIGRVTFEGLNDDQALLVISHAKEDVPGCVRDWLCLREPSERKPPRMGRLDGPLELNPQGWKQIWGVEE